MSTSYTWQVSSPNINNGPGVISSAYNVDDKSPFTTITGTNTSGYVKVFPDSTSTDLNIKNLEYAVQTDGVITYRVQDGTNDPRQFNSLQQLADGRGSWSGATTDQVKLQMNGILTSTAQAKNITPSQPTPGSPTPGSATPPDPNAITLENLGDSANFEIKSRDDAVKQHGNYSYPSKMPNDMDKIKFTMIEYRGRKLKPNSTGFEKRFSGKDADNKEKEKKILGTVTMGIQPRISDRNSVSWGDIDANTLGLLGGSVSLDLATNGLSGISKVLDKIGNTIGAEKTNIEKAIKLEIAGQAAGINGLISRVGGGILNPNLELLFDNPQLRPFDFTFQLTPRDDTEARAVKQIIRFFKQGMAVQRTAAELFLKAPNVFDINYLFGQKEDHPGLNKIKTCALQSCSVDYTPTGSYMTFPDGTMTAYNITLSFKELEPVYSDEYNVNTEANETVNNVQIGY
jgi:hypothetical protein